jgi:hypothetical protein
MTNEELRRHFERMIEEVFHQRNLDAFGKYNAPNFVIHRPWGSEDFYACKKGLLGIATAFPEFRYTVNEFYVAGDTAVVRYTLRGTRTNGTPLDQWGIEIDRWEKGMIVETWAAWDRLGVFGQPGGSPAPHTP